MKMHLILNCFDVDIIKYMYASMEYHINETVIKYTDAYISLV